MCLNLPWVNGFTFFVTDPVFLKLSLPYCPYFTTHCHTNSFTEKKHSMPLYPVFDKCPITHLSDLCNNTNFRRSIFPPPKKGDTATIDPVYSLLKCAADRSRSTIPPPGGGQGGGMPANKHAHACCPRAANNQSNSGENPARTGSRSSSPSSSGE